METNFDLTDEQQMIREAVRRFADEVVAPRARAIDEEHRFPMETWEEMAELGLTGIPFAEEYGGAGLDNLSYTIAVEELSRVCGSTGLTLAAHTSLGLWPIYEFAPEDLKRKYVPPMACGEALGAYGLTEPDAGSDSGGTRTTASRSGNEWILNGRKCFITNANHSSTFVITATTDRKKGAKGIMAFIVPRETPGFSLEAGDEKLGMRGSDWASLVFEDARIPADHVLGFEGEGFATFMKTLEGGRISIAALSLGIAQGAYEQATAYAKEREQFGKPLIEHQAVAFKLADMRTEITAARHLVYHSARLKDAHREFGIDAAIAKYYASEVSMRATFEAIQILGGNGYSREYPVERMYRDAKLCTIGEGTSEVQQLIISRDIMRLTHATV